MPIARNSKQRNAIYAKLMGRYDHPTAEDLYRDLKPEYPALSLATVYRNLKQLCEDGQIICIKGDTSDRFDANTSQHFHLSCKDCGGMFDLDFPEIPEITEIPKKLYNGRVDTYSLIYKGICENCLKKQKT